jgi:hypothetical protein
MGAMRILTVLLASVLLLLPADRCAENTSSGEGRLLNGAEKARARGETLHAWEGYKKYAWGHDSLKPLTKQPFDWYGPGHSLLMTPVDALDTLTLMGLTEQADEARKLIDTQLNLNQDIYVKDFEITIRLLGALISCYEGPATSGCWSWPTNWGGACCRCSTRRRACLMSM